MENNVPRAILEYSHNGGEFEEIGIEATNQ